MRRTITSEDKKKLDKYSNRLMTLMLQGKAGFSFLWLAIAMIVGCIIGAIVSFGILGQDHPWSLPFFLIFPLVLSAIVEILVITIGNRILRGRLFKVGKTEINGGTIIIDGKCELVEYTEDDLLDPGGHPYRILLPEAWGRHRNGERIIVVWNGSSVFLMPAFKELATLISAIPPQIPDEGSQHIGHQNQLTLESSYVEDADVRIRRFFRNYKNSNRSVRGLVMLGAWFFGFTGWIVVTFCFYGFFLQYLPIDGTRYFAWLTLAIPLLTFATADIVERVYRHRIKVKYKGLTSVSKVILITTGISFIVPHARDFKVVEKDIIGQCTVNLYAHHDGYDFRDAEKMKPGQIIYKYTTEDGKVFFGSK